MVLWDGSLLAKRLLALSPGFGKALNVTSQCLPYLHLSSAFAPLPWFLGSVPQCSQLPLCDVASAILLPV